MAKKSESVFTVINAMSSQERKDLLNDSKDVIESLSNIIGEDGKASVKLCQREDCFESTMEISRSLHPTKFDEENGKAKKMKRLIIENIDHKREVLFPSPDEFTKRKGSPTLKSTGRVMGEFPEKNLPNYNKWILIPKPGKKDVYKIYNEGLNGYMNAYDKQLFGNENKRRDIFVGDEREDLWKLFYHPTIKDAVAFEHLPTGEFLYGLSGTRGAMGYQYPGQTTRSIFLWKYADTAELLQDDYAFWYLIEC